MKNVEPVNTNMFLFPQLALKRKKKLLPTEGERPGPPWLTRSTVPARGSLPWSPHSGSSAPVRSAAVRRPGPSGDPPHLHVPSGSLVPAAVAPRAQLGTEHHVCVGGVGEGGYKSVVWGLKGLGEMALVPPPPHAGRTRGRKHNVACQLESAFNGQGKFKFQHRRHILAECPCPVERRVASWPKEGRVQHWGPAAAKRGNQGSFLPAGHDEPSPTL